MDSSPIMQYLALFLFISFRLISAAVLVPPVDSSHLSRYTPQQISNGVALADVVKRSRMTMLKSIGRDGDCSIDTIKVRKEWRSLPESTRMSFTAAIRCLQNQPSKLNDSARANWPGVRSRYDDYVATHIMLTPYIHGSAEFLSWHRYFIHLFEQELQPCGFDGALPYWEWGLDAQAPQDSPLFSGSESSMGSNGLFVPNRPNVAFPLGNVSIPPGTGGGCVHTGPFSNYTVSLGPIQTPGLKSVSFPGQYNPHCLSRDLNPWITRQWHTFKHYTETILNYTTIDWFQGVMQADPRPPYTEITANILGMHAGGHFAVGYDLTDLYASPSDPMFFLHHSQIDRIWSTWQGLDLPNRQLAIFGTETQYNNPPSRNMTINDMLNFVFVGGNIEIRDLMSTVQGPFCYVYG